MSEEREREDDLEGRYFFDILEVEWFGLTLVRLCLRPVQPNDATSRVRTRGVMTPEGDETKTV